MLSILCFPFENRSLEELRLGYFLEKGTVASGVPTAVGDTAAAAATEPCNFEHAAR
jgi:hypothetical protein